MNLLHVRVNFPFCTLKLKCIELDPVEIGAESVLNDSETSKNALNNN